MSSDPKAPDLPSMLHERLMEALEGDDGDASAQVETLCRAHPEHRDAIRSIARVYRGLGTPATGAALTAPARYELRDVIGAGGVGVVVRARDRDLDREVALKFLRPEHRGSEEVRRRFHSEARIGGRLQHPGVVPVYEFDSSERESPCFAMKLVEGESFAELLAARSELTGDHARHLAIFEQLCQTVAYAHDRGVVHRDLKPHNVLVGAFGEVQLVDWGFAKALSDDEGSAVAAASGDARAESDPAVSVVGSVFGSLPYMPPEQAGGRVDELDRRSDVFSLGAILCQILTGKPPYVEAEGAPERTLIERAAAGDLEPALQRLVECGAEPALVDLARACLSVSRSARPRDASAVARTVRAHLDAIGQRARDAELEAATQAMRAVQERKARRLTTALAAAVLGIVAVGGGGYLWIDTEHRARIERVEQQARGELQRHDTLVGQARFAFETSDDASAVELFDRAVAHAGRARELLQHEGLTAGANALLSSLGPLIDGSEVERDRARARATQRRNEQRLLRRLRAAREPLDDNRNLADYAERERRRLDAAYAAAFAEHGFDPFAPEVAKEVASFLPEHRRAIARALDLWAVTRRAFALAAGGADASWRELLRASRDVDRSPLLEVVRGAIEKGAGVLPALQQIRDHPDWAERRPETVLLLATLLRETGELGESTAVLDDGHRRWPDHFELAFELGLVHSEAGSPEPAAAAFAAARAVEPDALEARHQLGMALHEADDWGRALAEFEELARRDPDDGHWHHHAADLLVALDRADEAVGVARRAVALDPRNWNHHLGLGKALCLAGDLDGALDALRTAESMPCRRDQVRSWIGIVLTKRGDTDDGIAAYREALAVNPDHPDALVNLGAALFEKGDFRGAEALCRRAVAADPGRTQAHMNLGAALKQLGDLQGALTAFRTAEALEPNNSVAISSQGSVYAARGERQAAVTAYRRALRIDQSCAMALVNLSVLLAEDARDVGEALDLARRAVETAPDEHLANAALGDVLRTSGDLDGAARAYRKAIGLDARFAVGHNKLGVVLLRLGDENGAITVIRQAVELDPGLELGHRNLASILFGRGDWAGAREAFRGAAKLSPDDPELHLFDGICSTRLRRHEDAVFAYRRATEARDDYPEAWCNLADALRELGRYTEGLEAVRRGHELGTERGDAWRNPSAFWVERLERLAAREPFLLALLDGDAETGSADELLELQRFAYARGRHAESVRAFVAAERAAGADRDLAAARYDAACSAVLAASRGRGIPAEERARLRARARSWLTDMLAARRADAASDDAATSEQARRRIEHWQSDPDLAAVREPASLTELPDTEADAWRALWNDVASTLDR